MYDEVGQQSEPDTGWGHVAEHDEAPAVIDAVLRLETGTAYTKTELSDAAGVPLKALYLDGTLEDLAKMGFLQKHEAEGEETTFSVAESSPVYEAARSLDAAIAERMGDAE